MSQTHRNRIRSVFKILTLLMAIQIVPVWANESTPPTQRSQIEGFDLLKFRLQGTALFQAEGYLTSGIASWNPQFNFGRVAHVGIAGGMSILKQSLNQKLFLALEWGGTAGTLLSSEFSIDAFIGAQTWVAAGGTFPLLGLNLSYLIKGKLFNIFDRVVGGYSALLISQNTAHMLRLGLGVAL